MFGLLLQPAYLAAGAIGAYVGSQIDDILDPTPQESGLLSINYYKMALFAVAGIAIVYGAKRVLK